MAIFENVLLFVVILLYRIATIAAKIAAIVVAINCRDVCSDDHSLYSQYRAFEDGRD